MADDETIPQDVDGHDLAREKGRFVEGFIGGILMGLANLVPGISGGTMLLAAGVYPQFITGVAEVSTFRFRLRSVVLIACVAAGAVGAIVGLAGVVKTLVIEHRWIMYSLFIGLTLGGVPIIWRMVRPASPTVVVASIVGLIAMALLALAEGGGTDVAAEPAGTPYAMLFLAGLAGGSAMILPGVSGGYLLLVLGQYVTILAAIDAAKDGAQARDWAMLGEALHVFIPVGFGVLVGVVGVSNVIKVLLERYPKATLGFLLGLLLGAVFGLWPFRAILGAEEIVGMVLKGREMTTIQDVLEVDREDWPTETFTPSFLQILGSLGLIAAGFAISWGVSHLAPKDDEPGRRDDN